MKIKYNRTYGSPFRAYGTKRTKQENSESDIDVIFLIKPSLPSFLSSFQKISFKRELKQSHSEDTPISRFINESGIFLNEFELEFNNNAIACKIINYKEMWRNWVNTMQILNAKYEGDWVDRLIGKMTYKISDEKRLLKNIMNDFILNEIFSRNIHDLVFDNKTYKCERTWTETVFGMPLIFKQNCQLTRTSTNDKLSLIGVVDTKNKKNIDNIIQLCSIYNLAFEEITNIRQETIYTASNLEYFPAKIKSNFIIEGKDNIILKEIEISVNSEEEK